MKARLLSRLEVAVLPQHVRTRERRMPAEIDFDRRCKPTEIVTVALLHQERGLCQVHLARHVQHPGRLGGLGEHADGGGIAGEWLVGERVYLRDAEAHASKSIAGVSSAMLPSSARSR